MRVAPMIASTLLLCSRAAMSASSDYYLKIEGVGLETPGGPLFLKVKSSGDLDGDGLPDDGVIKLVCSGDELRAAYYNVKGPRDPASGQASGKRMHKPITFVKEWGAATPELGAMKAGYDVKKVEGTGARAAPDGDGWAEISLVGAEGICPAAMRATKTRSNIQNN
jgi:hypothetical protein